MQPDSYLRKDLEQSDLVSLYTDWQWLLGEVKIEEGHAQSFFGDLLFSDEADKYYFLDTLEGQLLSLASKEEALGSTKSLEHYFLISLAYLAEQKGLKPTKDELLMFKVPPILGGPTDVSNIEIYSEVVAISLTGQLHRQVKDLPAGAKISGFEYEE